MPWRIAFLLSVVATIFAGVQNPSNQKKDEGTAKPSCELSEEDYSVYAALLAGLGAPEDPEEAWHGKELLLVDMTSARVEKNAYENTGWGLRSKSKAAPGKDTIADFHGKAGDHCVLKSGFGDTQSYRLIPSDEIEGTFKKGWWLVARVL